MVIAILHSGHEVLRTLHKACYILKAKNQDYQSMWASVLMAGKTDPFDKERIGRETDRSRKFPEGY